MRTIIAGGRDYTFDDDDLRLLDSLGITEVACGGARGADECGRLWAVKNGILVRMFPAKWTLHGKAAGFIRNREMAEYAEQLVAFWDGESRGTANMIETARKMKLKVMVRRYDA